MATDVSSFKDAYKTAIKADFPTVAELIVGVRAIPFRAVSTKLRYGTNMHQPFQAYYPINNNNLSVGNLEMLKGGKDGLSLTNLQDMSQTVNVLKYFPGRAATVAMKHLNPCGFKVKTRVEESVDLYKSSRAGDPRSHFGAVVGFNYTVDVKTAEAIMETFVECVIAPGYEDGAVEVLRRNEGNKKLNNAIRVAKVKHMDSTPKFIGDDVNGMYNIRTLADGTLTLEVPYLTRIRTSADFVLDPMVIDKEGKQHIAQVKLSPETDPEMLDDCLTSWYLNINTRSNGVVFVRDGQVLAVGTGQQERVGAVEQAIAKAKQKGHSLEGSVMSSDAFFPDRDCIDAVAAEGVKAVVWPAGSMNDAKIIDAANEHGIALLATLERCFLHI